MKKIGHKLLCIILLTSPFLLYRPIKPRIIKQNTDERGLTSVMFIDKYDDTVALDFLTKEEYNNMFK